MSYEAFYQQFYKNRYVIFISYSLKENSSNIIDPIVNYLKTLERGRVSTVNMKEIKNLVLDSDTLEFLAYIHRGRKPMLFQTLNFKIRTQQELHSNIIFFDSEPRILISAAWVTLEDSGHHNRLLQYVPKSY